MKPKVVKSEFLKKRELNDKFSTTAVYSFNQKLLKIYKFQKFKYLFDSTSNEFLVEILVLAFSFNCL